MNRQDVKQLQRAQLNILKYVDHVCDELGINYFLAFGSLLGAIRHKGSIPWDADIDIALFRKDYEVLREYCINRNNEDFFYSDYTTDKNHYSPHALLIDKKTHITYSKKHQNKYKKKYDGIYIDIFPIDETSDSKSLQQKQAKNIMRLRHVVHLKLALVHEGKTGYIKKAVKNLISIILVPLSFRLLGELVSKEQQRYSGIGTNLYVIPTDNTCFDRIVSRDYYYPVRRVQYEDTTVSIPNKAEDILKQRYGNYMVLPPEDERWDYLESVIESIEC